jgi:hypothetical protein
MRKRSNNKKGKFNHFLQHIQSLRVALFGASACAVSAKTVQSLKRIRKRSRQQKKELQGTDILLKTFRLTFFCNIQGSL